MNVKINNEVFTKDIITRIKPKGFSIYMLLLHTANKNDDVYITIGMIKKILGLNSRDKYRHNVL